MPEDNSALTAKLNSNIVNAQPIVAPAVPQADLNALMADKDAKWKFSESGSGGSILVQSAADSSGGSAIKIEGKDSINKAEKLSQMMSGFFENAAGNQPFVAPRLNVITAADAANAPATVDALDASLETLKGATPADRKDKLENQQKALAAIKGGDDSLAVAQMEFAKGTQLNKLPVDQKLALYKSDAFAQTIGKAMPATIAMGLTDHFGVDAMVAEDASGALTNVSNFMFDPESGNLSVIDFDTQAQQRKPGDVTLGGKNIAGSIGAISSFLENSLKDPGSYSAAVKNMGTFGGMEPLTPFQSTMEAFATTNYNDNFFQRSEKNQIAGQISQTDMERFAGNLMSGLIEGLEYLKDNKQALVQAAKQTHEMVDGKKVEHFYNDEELDALGAELDKIDIPNLKQQMGNRMAEQESQRKQLGQARLGEIKSEAAAIENRTTEIKTKLDKIAGNPFQRMKGAATGQTKELKAELASLKTQSEALAAESNSIINQENLNDTMKQQRQQKAQPAVDGNQVDQNAVAVAANQADPNAVKADDVKVDQEAESVADQKVDENAVEVDANKVDQEAESVADQKVDENAVEVDANKVDQEAESVADQKVDENAVEVDANKVDQEAESVADQKVDENAVEVAVNKADQEAVTVDEQKVDQNAVGVNAAEVQTPAALQKHPSVRDLLGKGGVANAKAQLGLEQPKVEGPAEGAKPSVKEKFKPSGPPVIGGHRAGVSTGGGHH